MISTHAIYKKLVLKGMSDELAETMTEIMEERQDNLATKDDIKLLRSDFKQNLSELKSEVDVNTTKLETSLNWIKAIGVACLFLLIKLTFYK